MQKHSFYVFTSLYTQKRTCRLPITMVSSGAQTSSNELSDCMAQGLGRPIRQAPLWRHFGALETVCFIPDYVTFLYKPIKSS